MCIPRPRPHLFPQITRLEGFSYYRFSDTQDEPHITSLDTLAGSYLVWEDSLETNQLEVIRVIDQPSVHSASGQKIIIIGSFLFNGSLGCALVWVVFGGRGGLVVLALVRESSIHKFVKERFLSKHKDLRYNCAPVHIIGSGVKKDNREEQKWQKHKESIEQVALVEDKRKAPPPQWVEWKQGFDMTWSTQYWSQQEQKAGTGWRTTKMELNAYTESGSRPYECVPSTTVSVFDYQNKKYTFLVAKKQLVALGIFLLLASSKYNPRKFSLPTGPTSHQSHQHRLLRKSWTNSSIRRKTVQCQKRKMKADFKKKETRG